MASLVVGALALCASFVPTAPAAGASGPGTCGWSDEISASARNVLFIDAAATYWSAGVAIPAGGHLEITGRFPRARYLSLASYDQRGATIDHLADHEIDPEPGSVNPFRHPADEEAERRYAVTVVAGPPPSGTAPANTLYTETADGSLSTGSTAVLTLRTYLPDDRGDPTGGAGLPSIVSVTEGGERTVLEPCLERSEEARLGDGLRVPGGRGEDPPRWDRFLPDGLGENVDNAYVTETFMPSLGPVLTLRAKAPTIGTGDDPGQLRYWSLCSNRLSTAVHTCVADVEVPVDADGYWTVVVSRAEDRPANARVECGSAWLEAVPEEDTILVLRHMLPAADFSAAIQRVDRGSEEEQMGPYYPVGTYATVQGHEALGCPEASGVGTLGADEEPQAEVAATSPEGSGTGRLGTASGGAAPIVWAAPVVAAVAAGALWRRRRPPASGSPDGGGRR